ncbi:hypothetical protein C9374_001408 [Naegleria lovaniensis]|uniref:DJ-1/PfpI domain-containing protein n=1 Tax=Naegleria lovaniensis TaxID=51637 RepID=A0AA88GY56_NAELO|nr:uncharacterized protein C9374_001408 [Naegleria lovaniensis]KAG2387814.1 hypothetical protein C9374_001408 [Naegleria lovaniensis]
MVSPRSSSRLMNALVCIATGSEEMEAVNIIDVLRRGNVQVTVAKVHDQQQQHDPSLRVLGSQYGAIVLPGGMGGAKIFSENTKLLDRLAKQRKSEHGIVAAICASPALVLTKHNLLDGVKQVTCYPSLKDKMPHYDWHDEKVVVDGNVVTSQGPFTAVFFALKLIELMVSKEASQEVAKGLLVQ